MIAIDIYFLLNLCFDFLLMQMTASLLKYKRNWKRFMCSAILGAGWSSFALLTEHLSMPILFFIHYCVCPFFMCWIGFRLDKLKDMISAVLCFLLTAFVTGGAMDALYYLTDGIPSVWLLLGSMMFVQIVIIVSLKVFQHIESDKTLFYKVKLEFHGKKAEIVGIWDTGNRLCSLTKRPVHVIDEFGAALIFEPKELDDLIEMQNEMEKGGIKDCFGERLKVQWVLFCGLGGSKNLMPVVEIEQMTLEQNGKVIHVKKPLIGISKTLFCKGKSYQMILNPQDI